MTKTKEPKAPKAPKEPKAPKTPEKEKALEATKITEEAPTPKNRDIIIKGTGFCEGAVNGVHFKLLRGKEITVPEHIYNVLRDADELA